MQHILSGCSALAQTKYLQRHNNAFKILFFEDIIIDDLGGCSKEVEKNIKELVGDKCESIMRQMEKAILSSSLRIARMFKLSA